MQNIKNIQKNTLVILALAAIFVLSGTAFHVAQAKGSYVSSIDYSYAPSSLSSTGSSSGGSGSSSYVSSIDYTYPATTLSSDGGNYSTGCCNQTRTKNSPSYVSSIDYTYPATSITPTYTTYTYTTPTCSSGCHSTPIPPQAPVPPTCTISVSKSSIVKGEAITVTWSSTNATYGTITNLGYNLPPSGSHTFYPQDSTTFTGTFYGNGKAANCTANVVVTVPQCPANHTGTYPNCVPIQCPAGYTGSYPNCVPPQQNNLSCTISINNYGQGYHSGYWQPNSAVTLSWNSNGASYGFINNGFGNVGPSGSRTVYPTQTTTYTGTFYNYQGQQVTCSATVHVNTYVPPVTPNTPVVTLSAVPYTGLELGPVGTVLYWGFIAFWCLLAAYLIVVKRVQNSVYSSLKTVLFGSSAAHTTSHVAHTYATPVVRQADKTDDFILSQINRNR